MTNVLVASVFVVHLAVGAAAFEITLTGRRWRLPVPLAATQNYLDIEVQALPVLLSLMYFQYLRHARAVVQEALTADPLGSSDTWDKAEKAALCPPKMAIFETLVLCADAVIGLVMFNGTSGATWSTWTPYAFVTTVLCLIISAFPAEKELLYPPLTFLQPTGWSMEHAVGGVKFTVIEVEPFAG